MGTLVSGVQWTNCPLAINLLPPSSMGWHPARPCKGKVVLK